MKVTIKFILLSVVSLAAYAEQTVIPDYDTARDAFFWPELYKHGGLSVYCNAVFTFGDRLTVEHAYPADWIAEARGCNNRNDCDDTLYKHAEADLHNLWPALGRINSSRGKQKFGEIQGEDRRRFTDICPDYERTSGAGAVVEPQDLAKGELARSLLYMADEYELPLFEMKDMLIKWHEQDPVGYYERWRNEVIFDLQGTRNKYIDGIE